MGIFQWLRGAFTKKRKHKSPTRAERIRQVPAMQRATLKQYQKGKDILDGVEVLAAHDTCDACKKWTGKVYPLDKAPALPNPGCTRGHCRCTYIPVVKGMPRVTQGKRGQIKKG
jgi:hypothetical protein